MQRLLCLWLLFAAAVAQNTCTLSGVAPAVPKARMTFCSMFPDKTCCSNAHESYMSETFDSLFDLGGRCQSHSSEARTALQYLFCYGCSPIERDITDNDAGVIKICGTFAKYLDPKSFDNCGLQATDARGDACANSFVILPGNEYPGNDAVERLELFLNDSNVGKPPYFEDYTFQVCSKTDPDCNCFDYPDAAAIASHPTLAISLAVIAMMTTIWQSIASQ